MAAAMLNFEKLQILTVGPLQRANMRQWSRFHKYGGRPPSWICWAHIGTTCDDHLMVSIFVQNLVAIDTVVSIT